ncbi:MAG TPA: PHB depolymerase family esterase [Solirubrobacteraceae bacterium]|nr:PHB depolymerase family esterase [Solirubrobacteraceae bacterium]
MPPIDWRDLYASNRAVIEGGRPGAPPALDLPPLAARGPAIDLPGAPAGVPPTPTPADTPGGAWGRLVHEGRSVFVYTPPDLPDGAAVPLVVALHGCTQTAATFSAGSLLNRAADRHGFVVAYPEQSREHNPQCCWNWFTAGHQARGVGEPAFIAGATRALARDGARAPIDARRVFIAGMSAGGAMAAVMAATYPDVYAAVAIHSGLAYGCARSLPAATSAMTRGAPDPDAQGRAALAAMGPRARPVPALVIHGTADAIVCPVNGEHAARQWLVTNALAAGVGVERAPATVREPAALGGRAATRRRWTDDDGRPLVEHLEVEGLGHAWSGGAPGGSYTDARGPSAAAAICAFFARA